LRKLIEFGKKNQFNIYFFHFPYKFESRKLFSVRAKEIRKTIDELTLTNHNLISIVIPEDLVNKQMNTVAAEDNFPYYFNENEAKYIAQEIDKNEAELNRKI